MRQEWNGFQGTKWTDEVDVRGFIQDNYTAYDGCECFLEGPTEATQKLWGILQGLQKEERARRAAAKEPPADLARAGLSAAQTEELGRALMELKLTLAQEQVTNYKLKIKRSGRQVIITAT